MSPSPAQNIFSINFGQAVVRAVYLSAGKIYSTTISTTRGDLSYGLAAITKATEDLTGGKLRPDLVIVSGGQATLDALKGKIEGQVVPEDKAIAAAERYLTKNLGKPTAVLDVGPSAFLDRYPAEDIARWLPFVVNLNDIENHLANKRLYPRVLPVSIHEYEIDLAVARQAIIKLGEKEGRDDLTIETNLNLVLTGGLLTAIPKVADLMSLVLDSFYFKDGVTLHLDQTSDLVALGAVISEVPQVEIDLPSTIHQIGSAIHLGGLSRLSVDFGYDKTQQLELRGGEIIALPAEAKQTIKLNAGPKATYELVGGEGGVYIDNRRRPLGLAASSKESIAKIVAWRESLQANGLTDEEGQR